MFYDLACSPWGEEELRAAHRVLDSGMLTMGDRVREFEAAFAARFGVAHAVMTSSGSGANLLAVAALCHRRDRPLQRGDEAIVPAIAWATTYSPLQQYGLKLRFIDADLHSLNIDVAQLEAALTPRTRMVVAASVLGNPCALETLRAFCDRHGLVLLEDNCESMGARLGGRYCGSYGDIGTFSCFYSHQISTVEGGVLATNDAELADLARSLRSHGWARELSPGSPLLAPRDTDFPESYRFVLPGYNLRPQEMNAAIGTAQLGKLDALIQARRRNAELFLRLLGRDERFILQRENGESSWFAFTVILDPAHGAERRKVLAALKAADIGYRMITGGNFLRHEAIRHFDYSCAGAMTNADLAHDRGFFVGNQPRDLQPQLERLAEVLDRAAR
jgi:CDP-6-deoxy-D-xylo-4-hexulose-3-dehydrase